MGTDENSARRHCASSDRSVSMSVHQWLKRLIPISPIAVGCDLGRATPTRTDLTAKNTEIAESRASERCHWPQRRAKSASRSKWVFPRCPQCRRSGSALWPLRKMNLAPGYESAPMSVHQWLKRVIPSSPFAVGRATPFCDFCVFLRLNHQLSATSFKR
jgi:hypothetical protein